MLTKSPLEIQLHIFHIINNHGLFWETNNLNVVENLFSDRTTIKILISKMLLYVWMQLLSTPSSHPIMAVIDKLL